MVWVELILSHVLNLKSWNTKHIQELRLQVSKARLKNERMIQNQEDLKKEKVDSSNSNHFYQFCYPGRVGDEGRWIEVDGSLHAQIR